MDKPSIVAVVGRRVELRRSGKEHAGLCPFHAEKTPSFHVNEDKGLFHCFGCGESGDVFDFAMKVDGMTFAEAARVLGVVRGVTKPQRDPFRVKAEKICAWAGEQSIRVAHVLREIGDRGRLARELDWQEEIKVLARQWEILSTLADDLQNPSHVVSLWENRALVENLLKSAAPEPLPTFLPLTPEYRARLRSYLQ